MVAGTLLFVTFILFFMIRSYVIKTKFTFLLMFKAITLEEATKTSAKKIKKRN